MATLKKVAQEKGWNLEKKYMYGQVGNYLITVRHVIDIINKANFKLVYFPLINITEGQARNLIDFLKKNKKELKIAEYDFSGHVLIVKLAEVFKSYSTENFNNLFNTLTDYFIKNNISGDKSCVYCAKSDTDDKTEIDKISYFAHKDCIVKAKAELEQNQQNFKSANKNNLKGFVGAILGALVGAIPWIVLEIFWGYAAILAFVIGYAAFFGFKLFGGIVTKSTKWMIGVAILVGVLFSNIASVTYVIYSLDGLIVLDNYILMYTDPDLSSIVYKNLGIALLLAALGYYSVFRQIQSEEFNTEIK